MGTKSVIVALVLCITLDVANADIVYLNTGGVVKGKITESDDSEITIRTRHGQTTISRDDIDGIEFCESVAQLYYDKLDKLKQGESEAHFALGQWLKRINEPDLAGDEFEKTIIIDPDHAAARAELGYTRKDNAWVRKDAKPKAPRVVVKRGKKKPRDEPVDEHNLLTAASDETKKLINSLDSAMESERKDALKKLAEVYRWGDVQAVGEYMRYREAALITSLQRQEGEILDLLHGQLDGDLRERQVRWFERYRGATTMQARLHTYKTLEMLVKNELAPVKKLSEKQARGALEKHEKLLVFLHETQKWLKSKDEFTTEFGSCLTDTYHAILWARAGNEKRCSKFAEKIDSFDKYLVRTVASWHLEEKSAAAVEEMLAHINSLRNSKALLKLKINDIAATAALGHARDMYVNEFFSHTSPTFGTPPYRMQRRYSLKVNWKTETEGELISKRSPLAAGAFNGWMADEKAKETLLGKDWRSAGIAALGDYWVIILLHK